MTTYTEELRAFLESTAQFSDSSIYAHGKECYFESLKDWSVFHDINFVKDWFSEKRRASGLSVQEIDLYKLEGWAVDPESGNISHESGDFFEIVGLRVQSKTRERKMGWDQPIIKQVGLDGGILGIVRKRFDGIPHYLCEAKEEPGNYGKVQLSPTLQATFANLNKAHGGRAPHFSEIFLNIENSNHEVLFKSWLAEDGGRLHLKRNLGMLVEVQDTFEINIPNNNFIWLSLYQIKTLLTEDAWINPHIRGILAHV